MPSIKDIKKIKFKEEFIFFKADSIVSEIADSMSLKNIGAVPILDDDNTCLLYTSPSPRDRTRSRMPSSA